MKLNSIKNALSTLLFEIEKVEFGKMTTDKGVIGYEDGLEVGVKVFAVGENDEQLPIEDGDYLTDEGAIITIKEGVVEAIIEKNNEPEAEPEKEENPIEEEPIEAEKEPIEEETPIKEVHIEEVPIEEKPNEVEILRGEIEVLTARIEALEKLIEKLNGMPVDRPAEEHFEVIKKREQTPLKGKERAAALIRLVK